MGKRSRKGGRRGKKPPDEGSARFKPEGLAETGGILADLNRAETPATAMLDGAGANEMEASDEEVLAEPEAAEPAAAEPEAAEPAAAEPAAAEPEAPSALGSLLDSVAASGFDPRPDGPQPADEALVVEVLQDRPPRVPLEVYVKVVKGERVARALAKDISETGIFLAAMATDSVRAGDEVNLELTLPGAGEPIWAQGRVVRDQTRMGFHALAVTFTHLADSDRLQIREYVEARARLLAD